MGLFTSIIITVMHNYESLVDALDDLRKRGYGADFAEQRIPNDSHRIAELNPLALNPIGPGIGEL